MASPRGFHRVNEPKRLAEDHELDQPRCGSIDHDVVAGVGEWSPAVEPPPQSGTVELDFDFLVLHEGLEGLLKHPTCFAGLLIKHGMDMGILVVFVQTVF